MLVAPDQPFILNKKTVPVAVFLLWALLLIDYAILIRTTFITSISTPATFSVVR